MSTLAEIEAAIPQLTASELAELEQFVRKTKREKPMEMLAIEKAIQPGWPEGAGDTEPLPNKKEAAVAFLKRWTGMGVPMTDEEMDAQRTARLMQKHVK